MRIQRDPAIQSLGSAHGSGSPTPSQKPKELS